MTIVRITDDTTRAELAETLALLNADAKVLSRRGKCGTLTEDYALRHRRIDAVLSDYFAVPGPCNQEHQLGMEGLLR